MQCARQHGRTRVTGLAAATTLVAVTAAQSTTICGTAINCSADEGSTVPYSDPQLEVNKGVTRW